MLIKRSILVLFEIKFILFLGFDFQLRDPDPAGLFVRLPQQFLPECFAAQTPATPSGYFYAQHAWHDTGLLPLPAPVNSQDWPLYGERDRPGCRFWRHVKNPFPKTECFHQWFGRDARTHTRGARAPPIVHPKMNTAKEPFKCGMMSAEFGMRPSLILDCGGKRSATPLSHAREFFASVKFPVRPKAPSPLPLCRRSPKSSIPK